MIAALKVFFEFISNLFSNLWNLVSGSISGIVEIFEKHTFELVIFVVFLMFPQFTLAVIGLILVKTARID